MTKALVPGSLTETARKYIAMSKAANTIRAYRSDWQQFASWCEAHNLPVMPTTAETVALYITALASQGARASTIQRRITAISRAQVATGHPAITTREEPLHSVWAGIRRVHGSVQHGKAPVMTDDIRAMVATLPSNLIGTRDRALLLLGFAGAFRRSELVSLDVMDVETTHEGLVVTLKRSKTDQDGEWRRIGIPYGSNPSTCPVRALQAWLVAAGITEGPLFRSVNRHGKTQTGRLSDKTVALVVKRSAEAAGLDHARLSGHSLRAGLATSAASSGVSERSIMAQTGHKSLSMVRRYIREGNLWTENAAGRVGL